MARSRPTDRGQQGATFSLSGERTWAEILSDAGDPDPARRTRAIVDSPHRVQRAIEDAETRLRLQPQIRLSLRRRLVRALPSGLDMETQHKFAWALTVRNLTGGHPDRPPFPDEAVEVAWTCAELWTRLTGQAHGATRPARRQGGDVAAYAQWSARAGPMGSDIANAVLQTARAFPQWTQRPVSRVDLLQVSPIEWAELLAERAPVTPPERGMLEYSDFVPLIRFPPRACQRKL